MQLHITTKKIALGLFLLLGTTILSVSCNNSAENQETAAMQDQSGIPALLERKGELAKAMEWKKTKAKVEELKAKIAQNPGDVKARLQVAVIYMAEARVTNNSYYHQATIKILNDVLTIDPNNFEAYTYKASVAMSLHQFAQAKELAEKARSINPDNAYVCGVLVDANVELGNYAEAVAMSDKMQMLKPSLESYSRASYLREIFGNYDGAKTAMQLAVQAGGPGSESAEWARVTLADLYLNTGKLDSAEMLYQTSLEMRPDFTNAEIGLAKVEKARKNYDAAIAHTENAIRTISEAAYVSMLGELYELKGNKAKADEIKADVIRLLEERENEPNDNILMPHNANRELANAYMSNNQLDKALRYAMNDLKLRPTNIDANELVGWIYYLQGNYAQAVPFADVMLSTNTQNANTLYKAGMIYERAGETGKGIALAQKAKTINPYIDQRILLASK
jgi:tetratricopeptide (TPR) repeat protein